MRREGDGDKWEVSTSKGFYVKQEREPGRMKGNISKTQEDWKLTWSIRATEDTGTCVGKMRQNQSTGVS